MNSCIPELAYRQFSSPLHDKAARENIPIAGELELTRHCNLNCVHCYCAQERSKKELTTDEVYRVLDEVTDAGCFWLLFTGGEPLLRPDFCDIYAYAKKKGLIVDLFTNGTLVTSKLADYLKEWPPFSTEITLYGATRNTYEKITQIPGSYDKCLQGIEMLCRRGIPLTLKTMVMDLNSHEVEAMAEFAEARGLRFRYDTLINPRLNGDCAPCSFRVSVDRAVKLELADPIRRKKWEEVYEDVGKLRKGTNLLYNCCMNMWSFHVTAYGNLQACIMAKDIGFDLKTEEFGQCWNGLIEKFKSIEAGHDSKCQDCELFPLCSPCPAWAHLENQDPNSVVEYACETAKLMFATLKQERSTEVQDEETDQETLQEAYGS